MKSNDPKFFCEHCEFCSKYWAQMEQHANTVHSDKKFKCKKCDFETSNLKNVKLHDKHIHVGSGSLNCDVCGFKSINERKLAWHKNFLHKGVDFDNKQVSVMVKPVSKLVKEKQVNEMEMQDDKVG